MGLQHPRFGPQAAARWAACAMGGLAGGGAACRDRPCDPRRAQPAGGPALMVPGARASRAALRRAACGSRLSVFKEQWGTHWHWCLRLKLC
jgi:hypothetical protein